MPDRRWREFSWLNAHTLLDSANDQIAKLIHDLVNPRRQRWIAAQRAAGVEDDFSDFVIKRDAPPREWTRFLIVGDPGEADASEYAVIDPLLAVDGERGSDFMLILSDVVYPAGDVNDYINAFYIPYEGYGKPILALPGNHDWYDGLNGFMWNICGAEALPPSSFRLSSYSTTEAMARALWRRASRPSREKLLRRRSRRQSTLGRPWRPEQPGPYFAVDLPGLRLISIDTGIAGTIDREQGEWLRRVSRSRPEQAKVLLTGKPIWVDGEFHPCPIEWAKEEGSLSGYDTVDDVVRDPRNGYVAAIGGDIHNYQRYRVTVTDERKDELGGRSSKRRIEYVVAGGGGAFLTASHRFGKVDNTERDDEESRGKRREAISSYGYASSKVKYLPPPSVAPVGEAQFRSYPTRGDSLAYYAHHFGQLAFWSLVISLGVLAGVIAGLLLFGDEGIGTGEPDLSISDVFWWVLGGVLGSALLLGCLGSITRRLAPRGARTATSLLIVPSVAALCVVGLSTWWDDWDWIWRVMLVTLGTAALPVAITLFAYYVSAVSGNLLRKLALSALIVGIAVLYVPDALPDQPHPSETAGGVTTAIACIAIAIGLVLVVIAQLSNAAWVKRCARRSGERRSLSMLLPVLGFAVPLCLIMAKFWDAWAIRVSAVAWAAILFVLALLVLILVVCNRGARAVFELAKGRLDPDKAIAFINSQYGVTETGDQRVGELDERTKRICGFLNSRRFLHKFISEAGNADSPPMFKSFLQLEIADEVLRVTCYGVTGWRQHDGAPATDGGPARPVPIEDCVEIPLGQARELAEALAPEVGGEEE